MKLTFMSICAEKKRRQCVQLGHFCTVPSFIQEVFYGFHAKPRAFQRKSALSAVFAVPADAAGQAFARNDYGCRIFKHCCNFDDLLYLYIVYLRHPRHYFCTVIQRRRNDDAAQRKNCAFGKRDSNCTDDIVNSWFLCYGACTIWQYRGILGSVYGNDGFLRRRHDVLILKRVFG